MNAVHELRKFVGLTQTQLAATAGTSQPTIAAYESGQKSPTLRTYQRLCAAVGVDIVFHFDRLMTREERRSLHLHRSIAEKLLTNPEAVISKARKNTRRMLKQHPHASSLLHEWSQLLQQQPSTIVDTMLDQGQHARELRHMTPFAGILSSSERAAAYATFRSLEQHTT